MPDQPDIIRFGVFEIHLATGELRKNGARVKLQEQPFQVLAALLESPGEVVTKEELKERLWAGDTFVDFDHSLSTAVNKIREALGDSASSPRFIETVPRRGYRFVGGLASEPNAAQIDADDRSESTPRRRWLWLSVAGLAVIAGVGYWSLATRNSLSLHALSSDASPEPSWNISRLTSDSGLTYQPTVSADESLIAYTSDRAGEGNLDIWVRRVDGGELVRLTDDPADDHEPSLSPDGSKVAFRSERGDGGIYVVPATGGDARLIFPGARLPRFSPDGEWIAAATDVDYAPRRGAVHAVSPDGRKRRRVAADFIHASYPIWSPDGRSLLLSGNRTGTVVTSWDWFAVSLDGSHVVQSGAGEILAAHGLSPTRNNQVVPAAWNGDGWVYFSAGQGDTENIWKLKISPTTHKAEGPPLRVTVGPGVDQSPVILGSSEMVFSSAARNINIWSLPVDANGGQVLGSATRLTDDAGNEFHPGITTDGARLIYRLESGGEESVWIRDVLSGEQRLMLQGTPSEIYGASLSRDGSRIAIVQVLGSGEHVLREISVTGGAIETLCPGADVYVPWSWSTGRRFIAYGSGRDPGGPNTIGVLDTETCGGVEVLSYLNHNFYQAYFSPDDHWIAFMSWDGTYVTIWIAPLGGLTVIDHNRWIRVYGPSLADKPRWAPDGNSLYFTGQAVGDLVIYRQALAPRSKQPVGEPEVIYRFPNGRQSFREVDLIRRTIDVATDSIVYPMAELSGNIWLMEP